MIGSKVSFALALLASAAVAGAQTVVVTPTNTDGFHNVDQSGVGSAAITTAYPRSGDGSLQLTGTSGADKDYYGVYFATPQALSSVTSAGFDWYRDASSTAGSQFAPSYHLLIAATDNSTHVTSYSELVWENFYQTNAAAPTNTWETSNIINDDFWRAMGGPTNTNCSPLNSNPGSAQKFATLSDWVSTCYAGQTADVYGISVGFGSGWNGTFNGAADNLHIGFGNDAGVTYNFEPDITTTPEPGSLALLGTGLVALVPMVRRRRRA